MIRASRRVFIETITPDKARQYLATQFKNRKVRPTHVKAIARAMEQGRFIYCGDPIRLNTVGELVDGQHRLLACVQTGVHFDAVVITDVPVEAADVIDTGIKRSPGDILELQGFSDGTNIAAALRWLWRYENDTMVAYAIKPQMAELKEVWTRHPHLKESLHVGAKMAKLIIRSLAAALHCLFVERDARAGNIFFDSLLTGEGLYKGDAVYSLRSRLVRNTADKAKLPPYEVAALTIKAFNAYRVGKKLKYLRWVTTGDAVEQFPVIA